MKIIKYSFGKKSNIGSEETPIWRESTCEVQMPWSEASEELARREAYNGEYTIEDDGQPEPETQLTPEERIAELEEALEMLLSEVTE